MAVVGAILFAFYVVVAAVAYAMGVPLVLVLLGSVALVGVQYKIGKWSALRSVGAEEMPESGRWADVHRRVESLATDMGIEKPQLMVADMGVPNAFAVGRKGASTVVVSNELASTLDGDELEGVLAHELSHVKNRDVVTMVVGQGIASIVGIAAQWLVLLSGDNDLADFFLSMVVGSVVQFVVMLFVLAISRYREYVADADAKRYVGSGEPLARALEKIQRGNENPSAGTTTSQRRGRGQSGPASGRGRGRGQSSAGVTDQVGALCIFDDDERSIFTRLVATHPPVEKRIERLRE
ncbi:probable protease htpX homolog [Halarchaeum acidiphilum MH1-52-1]|uniref:Probable protease htpX homolog n=1 Tax=Halarchaeum acidiphilum MH1-52-1 TaxID=1261545 RepID=U3A2L2_9EURY|nr:probable protease htpX homolog [Halarchaeum acidiphilum MH1-52-1]